MLFVLFSQGGSLAQGNLMLRCMGLSSSKGPQKAGVLPLTQEGTTGASGKGHDLQLPPPHGPTYLVFLTSSLVFLSGLPGLLLPSPDSVPSPRLCLLVSLFQLTESSYLGQEFPILEALSLILAHTP